MNIFKTRAEEELHQDWQTWSHFGSSCQSPSAFDNFIINHSSILLHSRNLPSRVPYSHKVKNNFTDTTRIGPTTSWLLEEVFGDKEQSPSVLCIHVTKLKNNLHVAEDKVMKQSDISTNPIIQTFTLENNNEVFIKVWAKVDRVMSESVVAIYGDFLELTTPILTQVCYKPNLPYTHNFSSYCNLILHHLYHLFFLCEGSHKRDNINFFMTGSEFIHFLMISANLRMGSLIFEYTITFLGKPSFES